MTSYLVFTGSESEPRKCYTFKVKVNLTLEINRLTKTLYLLKTSSSGRYTLFIYKKEVNGRTTKDARVGNGLYD